MRPRSWPVLVIVLALHSGSALGATPERLSYDRGLRGVAQSLWGKKVKEGASTHLYAPRKAGLVLVRTQSVEELPNRALTTTLHLRPIEERGKVEEIKVQLGGVVQNGYLYRVEAAGLKQLELKAEILETVSESRHLGRFVTRRYQLSDGVIEQWTNSNGTTFRVP